MDDIREDQEDRGASLSATGLSSASPMEPQASPPKASIPSADSDTDKLVAFVRTAYPLSDDFGPHTTKLRTALHCLCDRAIALDAECEQRIAAHEMAFRQAMANGQAALAWKGQAFRLAEALRPLVETLSTHPVHAEARAALADYDLFPASAIEARSDATAQTGAAEGESAVAKPGAQTPSGDSL